MIFNQPWDNFATELVSHPHDLFGGTIQFCGVTKLGWRNGVATWAVCGGRAVRSRGVPWGKPVARLSASRQLAESLALAAGVNGLEVLIPLDGGVRLNGLVPGKHILSFRQELAPLGLRTN